MSKVLRVGVDLPERILDLFAVVGDDLCWIDERPEGRGWQRKRVPWGEKAGGAIVLGRGRVICLSGMNLLTCDVRYALENAGEWPWQHGTAVPIDWVATSGADMCTTLARSRWRLHAGVVVWRETRGDNAREGEKARGLAISGFRCPVITTNKIGFLYDDVKHFLTIGTWPWETAIDWD